MIIAVRLVLFLFITFLFTPTVVGVIEKSCDTSCFYSMSEEELSHKEIKAELLFDYTYEFQDLSGCTSGPIVRESVNIHDSLSAKIFIPPPEQV